MDGYYDEYLSQRSIHPRFEKLVVSWHEKMLKLLQKSGLQVNKNTRLLEVGYGHGYFASIAVDSGITYKAVDISEAVIAHGLSLGHDVSTPNVLAGEEFDFIYCSHVLEHCADWLSAREMIAEYSKYLRPGGHFVIIGPDFLDWKEELWSTDFSHGYPTTRRNVVQLMGDVGLNHVAATYHRGGHSSLLVRAVLSLICAAPHVLIDQLLTPNRAKRGEGFFYSWKTMFGWRQLFIVGQKTHSN